MTDKIKVRGRNRKRFLTNQPLPEDIKFTRIVLLLFDGAVLTGEVDKKFGVTYLGQEDEIILEFKLKGFKL